jgi:23S rRNA (uracil1939-C5)-methyltransferase
MKKADVLVLDPPRTGARDVCEGLVKQPVKRVVYVSCDAATLGRDLGILDRLMQVERLVVFEMFPQTPHLETVATLVKRR